MKNYNALLARDVWTSRTKPLLMNGYSGQLAEDMSIILENTRRALLSDAKVNNLIYIPKVTLPLVQRVYPNMIAQRIVGVQPVKSAQGTIRFLDFVEEENGKTIYPWTSDVSNRNHSTPLDASHVTTEVIMDESTPSVAAAGNLKTYYHTIANEWAEGTLMLVLHDTSANADIPVAQVLKNGDLRQLVSSVNGTSFTLAGNVNTFTRQGVVNLSTVIGDVADTFRFDYYKNWEKVIPFGSDQTFNKIRPMLKSIPVDTVSRKLGASWSYEFLEDFESEFGESGEDKIVDTLSQVILTEIDSEILYKLFTGAYHSNTWDMRMPGSWTRGPEEWYKTLMVKVEEMNARIFQSTHISGATFMVCSPATAAYFRAMNSWQPSGSNTDNNGMSMGTVKAGSVQGQYDVFVSPLVEDNKILMGFKGKQPHETGFVYSPYVPIRLTPVTYQEMPTIMARTRYATTMLRPDFYGVITVKTKD